jgi:hypothetical protein
MHPRRLLLALSCALVLAACGGDAAEQTPPPAEEPAPNPVRDRVQPVRDAAAKAEADMKAGEERMNREAAAAAGEDTTGAAAP